jgi:hypothetical protein
MEAPRVCNTVHNVLQTTLGPTIRKSNQRHTICPIKQWGEERNDKTDRYGESLEEATNSALAPASPVEDKQHVAQPLVENSGDKGDKDDGDEEVDEEYTE